MIFIIAAGDAEGSVVLTDGEVNVLVPDEEVNAIVEAVDAVQDADGNIVAAWDGEDNVLAADEEGNTIVEAAYGSGVVLGSNGNIIVVGDAELRRATWC